MLTTWMVYSIFVYLNTAFISDDAKSARLEAKNEYVTRYEFSYIERARE